MKTKFISSALILTLLIFAVFVSAQNPQSDKAGKSTEEYESLFRKSVDNDPSRKEKIKISSQMHVEKLGKDIKLNKNQQDSLFLKLNELMLRLQFAQTIENKEDKQDFQLNAELIYSNEFEAILTDEQKTALLALQKSKSEEKNFTPYLEDHKDEYKQSKPE